MAILLVFYPTHKKRNQDNFHIKLLLKVSFSALMSVNDHFKRHSIKKGLIVSWRAFNMRNQDERKNRWYMLQIFFCPVLVIKYENSIFTRRMK